MGLLKNTDRDSYSMKRIDLAGSLLLELYRELWGQFKRETSLRIDKEHKFHFKEYDELDKFRRSTSRRYL